MRQGGLRALLLVAGFVATFSPLARAEEPQPQLAAPEAGSPSPASPAGQAAQAPAPVADDPAAALQAKRDQVSKELTALSETMKLSTDKADELRRSIDALDKSSASLKEALISSASRRKEIEQKIADGEKKLADYGVREDGIRKSFRARRAVLAEVLGALERMGRNPPPALLVKPEDALGAVRTAILLGAVVPGMRKETEKLAHDLQELADLKKATETEREAMTASLKSRQEEEARMDMLLGENARLSEKNSAELQEETRRAEALAQKSTSLQGLISGLESEIASVKAAGEQARLEEQKRQQMTDEQREKARQDAEAMVPDKNRIAPAFSFDELKGKLQLPAVGDVLRQFGDPDGTGHDAKGMVLATGPGAVVTAPADGTVVYAGQFRSYGKMVILNTGEGYHVILSGMDRVTGHAGQFVLSGEPIGVMGEKRVASAAAFALETDRPTLYIEFRKDGNSVDSRPWWAKDAGKVRNDS
ncbi:murein hydrolase activator EnvC family protein [Rhizobium paknamense]|uniref:Septal ring factor EnvC (AmiA/AmiB activator) n=1 Tax=Rhizobium paknamense TaxID=1206817 RepID=A0ABU0IGI9_9HYPH|nr:murein hydrolase activator EnvC [Rhizobium paknamense]MDQ0457381.1 septal ring factor EnvC (AmiA/AmiB activator) [Rhizobium paknamense]